MTILRIIPLAGLLFLAACQVQTEAEQPASLEEQRTLLREKENQLEQLSEEIESLRLAIAEADPQIAARDLVTVMPLSTDRFEHYITMQATVEAEDLVDATAEIGGRVLRLTVEEGDVVIKGQLIATIDVEQLEKQIEEIETALELATTVYERQKRLWDQNIGSEIQFLEAKNNRERLEKNLERLTIQQKNRNVFAPITGSVERVIIQSGELAAPGSPIVQILDTNDLVVQADVPERYLNAIQSGERVKVRIPVLDQEFEAPVTQIGRTIDPANRTFEVEVDLRRGSRNLKPNLLAEMMIRDFAIEDAIIIPLDRVQQEVNGRRYVYLQTEGPEGPTAKKAYIEIGESSNGRVVVREGLKSGDILIMDGARNLSDGQLIQVAEQNPVANG